MKKEIKINGMHCSHCVRRIEEALEELRPTSIKVSLDTETVTIEHENNVLDHQIIAAIEDAGYEVESIKNIA